MSNPNISNREVVPDTAAAALAPKTYVEWRNAFPLAEPTVRVTFHGLFCFFFDGQDGCFVGTHNTTQQPGHPSNTHPHDYQIRITQKDGGAITDQVTHNIRNPQRFPRLNISTTGSAFPGGAAPGVYAYTGPNHAQFNRNTGDDAKDWRWIIDFEDRVYPGGVRDKIPSALLPGVKIDNGLFYTCHKTRSLFDLVPEGVGANIPLNSVAEIMGVNIYLAQDGFVRLTGGGPVTDRRQFDFAPNRIYEVEILNLCDGDVHAACKYDPDSPNKEQRNDFFLYYDTFDRLQNPPEYLLIRRPDSPVAGDDTPCGATGFGQTRLPLEG